MSHIEEYWTVDQAAEYYGISKNSLNVWRLDASESWKGMAEPDYRIGGANLWHKDKWHELLGIHYAENILHLRKLGLVFDQEQMTNGLIEVRQQGYDEGYGAGIDEGYERGRIAGPRTDLPKFTLPEAIEPLEETNEPLVAYATTKGPDFGKLTDGHGFQPIV